MIQQALINQNPPRTENSEDQATGPREETELEPSPPGRRQKGKRKGRKRLQEARNTLEESGEKG